MGGLFSTGKGCGIMVSCLWCQKKSDVCSGLRGVKYFSDFPSNALTMPMLTVR